MEKINVSMKVNGKNETLSVEPRTLLVHALREHLEYTGAHIGCSSSHCGACTVDMSREWTDDGWDKRFNLIADATDGRIIGWNYVMSA